MIQFITALGIGALTVRAIFIIISALDTSDVSPNPEVDALLEQFPFVRTIILYGVFWLAGYVPASFLVEKLLDLWPSVEFQVGPPHKQTERRRRSYVVAITILGVIPLIVQLLYDLLRD